MEKIKVVLVDDHMIVREGLRMILENDAGIQVVGEAADLSSAFSVIRLKGPDVVLLDILLGNDSSVDSIRPILELCPKTRVLMITGIVDQQIHRNALNHGAHGLILKHVAGSTLVTAIKKVHQGEAWIDRTLTSKMLKEASQIDEDAKYRMAQLKDDFRHLSQLTKRELEIVELIAKGLANRAIAVQLNVSEKTVRNHLTSIYDKLDLSSRLELAIFVSGMALGS